MREDWKFQYSGEKLLAAANAKVGFHIGRKEVWEKRKIDVMKEIREKGLNVEETEVSGYGGTSNRHTNCYGPQVTVDTTFQRKLNEAHGKIIEHQGKIADYEAWVQVLADNTKQTYDLDVEDYGFFFGTK
jgi:hypothetical protein